MRRQDPLIPTQKAQADPSQENNNTLSENTTKSADRHDCKMRIHQYKNLQMKEQQAEQNKDGTMKLTKTIPTVSGQSNEKLDVSISNDWVGNLVFVEIYKGSSERKR